MRKYFSFSHPNIWRQHGGRSGFWCWLTSRIRGTTPTDPCKYILSSCWDKQGRFGFFRCSTYLCVWLCPPLYKIPTDLRSVLHLATRPVGLISNRYEPYILDQRIKPMVKCNESVKSYSSSCSALHMRSDGWLLGFIRNPDSFSL